ncbi:1-deoxy-D-xylulose-5-phosphate synthase [Limnochorda pilosa]|uniref:1-deoxy-D-xylulose-5-phosphate synthase n=1 Tax=Limnochorda pilosa TaxID=1555112 RepID=A0A0K2SNK6_LIMPI|nr:1-deoxy-D-xylulose-5-phosphate synthase [Limnochorda pilosa]BAS28419.1 1-deoxy-D-xylulose-5-phosphate synthase [Limnochorda pilosa]
MGRILETIGSPADLKGLSLAQLKELASEIREELVETVAQTGGHLGPNLGVVELTLALHTVLSSPRDRIVWDVGHQAYVHKLLTGRREQFRTLRQEGGLSGFTRRSESPHDPFGAGHASTAVSAALGIALARDALGERFAVVAVVGDGALTGGMAYEGLNNAGTLGTDLVVILNDNEMSIAPNVGAIARYLTQLRLAPGARRAKEDVERLLSQIPGLGEPMLRVGGRMKEGLKHLLLPGTLFEELGFSYYGPLDGHDIPTLQHILRDGLDHGGPVLIHVVTQKGRGYRPAEEDPATFHGLGPFTPYWKAEKVEPAAAVERPKPPSYSKVFATSLIGLAHRDPRVVAITAAMPAGTGLSAFQKVFPDRCFDVGIAEQNAVTMAAGMSTAGLRPVVALYSTFLQRGYDQLIHDVCVQNLPVTFALDRAGIVGDDGPTHHGVFDLAYMRCIPNLVLMAPKDGAELQDMLATALSLEGPAAVRYPKGACPLSHGQAFDFEREPRILEVGRSELLRPGTDVAIIALGAMVGPALEAAGALEAEGIQAAVLNARFVKPLDEGRILDLARRTGRLVTVEEGVRMGGFGSAVLELLSDRQVAARVVRLGVEDRFVEHGGQESLRAQQGLSAEGIADAARRLVKVVSPAAWRKGAENAPS